jgi:type I restriction enzyme M protein
VKKEGWSLNPGRYVGVPPEGDLEEADFNLRLTALNEELRNLSRDAQVLAATIDKGVARILKR